jgi:hypothetical protein
LLLAPTLPLAGSAILLALNLSLALQLASTPPLTKLLLKMPHTPARPLKLLPAPIPPLELIHALALLPTAPILPLAMLLASIPPPSLLHALLPALGILLVPTQPQTVLFALTLPLA